MSYFVEVGTNRPLYLHNDPDHYWVDYDYHGLITHYSSTRAIDLQSLKDEYQHLLSLSKEEVTKDSPFIGQTDISGTLLSHLMRGKMQQADTQKVDSLLTILKKKIIYPVVCLVFRKRIRASLMLLFLLKSFPSRNI